MTQQMPPDGRTAYRVTINLDGRAPQVFHMTLPGTIPELNIATLRVGRRGGANERDYAFRELLYPRIGAVTVAGGHVEAAMKRLLILLMESSGRFSLVDKSWSELHTLLVKESRKPGGRRKELAGILQWAVDNRLKERRDNVVHAYWWIFDDVEVTRSRFFRKEDGANMTGTFADLDEDANLLFEYAQKLDDLLGEDWARALLFRD
ncbi:hypothetical protein [Catenulispora subtropica]|uniref:Uncharacterized protein n=1 Tax=Catenulispora subtropica TaxID=450798 RepID=A0ABP5C1C4_9ACTN